MILRLFVICLIFSQLSIGQAKIIWPAFMSRQDPKWDTLTPYYFDGLPSGNGFLGSVLYKHDISRDAKLGKNTLVWDINRTDVVDSCQLQQEGYRFSRLSIGKFYLKLPNEITDVDLRIDIWDGMIRGKIICGKDSFQLKSYTHATRHVMVTEISANQSVEGLTFDFYPYPAGCIKNFNYSKIDYAEGSTYEQKYKPIITKVNDVFTHHQDLNAGRSYEVIWKQLKEKNKLTLYSTIDYSPSVYQLNGRTEILKSEASSLLKSHTIWWHDFLRKSYVSLPDKKLENFYWIQMYKYGSLLRPNGPLLDLSGPWYNHSIWRGIWWNWNTQGMYLPLVKINHVELISNLMLEIERNLGQLKLNVPIEFRSNSIGISRASGPDLLSPINLKDSSTLQAGREVGNLTWALHVIYLQGKYSNDVMLQKDRLFPVLKQAVQLYIHIMKKDNQGKIHLPTTFSPEYKSAEDLNYDLALFKWGCKALLQLDSTYHLNDPSSITWKEVVKNLTDFPQNENEGLMIGKNVSLSESHRHFSHLLSIYPLQILNSNQHNQLIRNSLRHWFTIGGGQGIAAWSHLVGACMYAYLGEGDSALVHIQKSMPYFSASTLYREAGMCMETPLMGVESITNLLLQSNENEIRIFPALPSNWGNVEFANLLAWGGFEVTATRFWGATTYVKLKSLKGGKINLRTGFKDQQVKFKSTNPNRKLDLQQPEFISLELQENEEIELIGERKKNVKSFTRDVSKNNFGKKKF